MVEGSSPEIGTTIEMRPTPTVEFRPSSEMEVGRRLINNAFLKTPEGKGAMGLFERMEEGALPEDGQKALAMYRKWNPLWGERCPKKDPATGRQFNEEGEFVEQNGTYGVLENGRVKPGDFREAIPKTLTALRKIVKMGEAEGASEELKAFAAEARQYLEILEPRIVVQFFNPEAEEGLSLIASYSLAEWEGYTPEEQARMREGLEVRYAFTTLREGKQVEVKSGEPAEKALEEADRLLTAQARMLFERKRYEELFAMIPAVAGKSAKAKIEVLKTMQAQAKGREEKAALRELIGGLKEAAKEEGEVGLTRREKEMLLPDDFREIYDKDPEKAMFGSLQRRREELAKYKIMRREQGATEVEIRRETAQYRAENEILRRKAMELTGGKDLFVEKDLLGILGLPESPENLDKATRVIKGFEELLNEAFKKPESFRGKFKRYAGYYLKLLLVLCLCSSMVPALAPEAMTREERGRRGH